MLKTSKTIRDCLDHILNALCLNVKPLILFANSFGKMQAKKTKCSTTREILPNMLCTTYQRFQWVYSSRPVIV